jgi:protein tyrosine/serine phosphatase
MYRVALFLTVFLAGSAPVAELPGTLKLPGGVEIARFSTLDKGIYRGGQPSKEGFLFLKRMGVKTIVNLRAEDDEGDLVRGLGLNYVHIPIRLIFPWSRISESSIQKYFEVIDSPDNYPIFVHCRRGADRTGALSAMYRINNQGWPADKAWTEARAIGLHWWYRGLKSQAREFITDRIIETEPATAF